MAQAGVRSLLTEHWPASVLRQRWDEEVHSTSSCWQRLADAGLLGLRVPVETGGEGLDERDLVLLLEETGRVAFAEPVVEVAAVAVPLLVEADGTQRGQLADVMSGRRLVAVGMDLAGPFVLDADIADACVLQDGDAVHLVQRAAYEVVRQPSVDGARRLFAVRWLPNDSTLLAEGDDARSLLAVAGDRGCLGSSAQLLGLADRMLAMAADHARNRVQFGRPIGSYQAVKHELSDALIALEFARPLVYRAAWSVAVGSPNRARDVSMAKLYASQAAQRAARTSLQVHGALGYTWEHDLHMWMKRVWALAAAWGAQSWHRSRVEGAVLGSRNTQPAA